MTCVSSLHIRGRYNLFAAFWSTTLLYYNFTRSSIKLEGEDLEWLSDWEWSWAILPSAAPTPSPTHQNTRTKNTGTMMQLSPLSITACKQFSYHKEKKNDVWPNCKRVWHTCKGNLIQPLQMQQVSNRLGHSLHQEPRIRIARGSATSVLTPVILTRNTKAFTGYFCEHDCLRALRWMPKSQKVKARPQTTWWRIVKKKEQDGWIGI